MIVFGRSAPPDADKLAALRALYDANFPPVLQKPFGLLQAGIADGSIALLTAERTLPPPARLLGFATLVPLPHSRALYLGYLATAPELHGMGIGGQLFDFLVRWAQDNSDAGAVVWEVEAPEPDPDHLHNRRIRFYERHGAHLVTLAPRYRMADGQGGTIALRFMWIPLRADTPAPDRDTVARWIRDLYPLVYPGAEAFAETLIAELHEDA